MNATEHVLQAFAAMRTGILLAERGRIDDALPFFGAADAHLQAWAAEQNKEENREEVKREWREQRKR